MKFYQQLEHFFAKKLGITKDIYNLFKLEARLAEMSIGPLIVNISLLIAIAITFWLSIMVLLAALIWIYSHEILIAIGCILLANLLFILFIVLKIKKCIKEMSFSRTRDCLRQPQGRIESEKERARANYSRTRQED